MSDVETFTGFGDGDPFEALARVRLTVEPSRDPVGLERAMRELVAQVDAPVPLADQDGEQR